MPLSGVIARREVRVPVLCLQGLPDRLPQARDTVAADVHVQRAGAFPAFFCVEIAARADHKISVCLFFAPKCALRKVKAGV